jgi:hypothetical protein
MMPQSCFEFALKRGIQVPYRMVGCRGPFPGFDDPAKSWELPDGGIPVLGLQNEIAVGFDAHLRAKLIQCDIGISLELFGRIYGQGQPFRQERNCQNHAKEAYMNGPHYIPL